MTEKRGLIVGIILVILIASANIYLYKYKSISARAVEEIPSTISSLSFNKIAFITQWVLLLLVLILLYLRHLKKRKEEKVRVSYSTLKSGKGKSKTDIDLLYSLLKEKKHLKIEIIAKIFGVDKEKALDWARILENSSLATINYPAFSEPEVELKEEEKAEEKKEKIKEEKKRQ